MTSAFTHIRTADGTVIARDPETGVVVSGRTLDEAFAELRRLTASHTHACEALCGGLAKLAKASRAARHPREGMAA